MSNPTSNYSWQMPTSSDLVTDLPADFEVFGQAVDTTTKALNPSTTLGDIEYRSSTANTNTRLAIGSSGQVLTVSGGVPAWATPSDQTPLTTKGDLFTYSTADARLGVGTNGQVLTADSAEATGIKWATPSATAKSYSLLNAGGTSLTGASTITVSSISADELFVLIIGASTVTADNVSISLRFNADSSSSYPYSTVSMRQGSTYSYSDITQSASFTGTSVPLFDTASVADSTGSAGLRISGASTTGVKVYTGNGAANYGSSGLLARHRSISGAYTGSSAITSISIISSNGNFDAGTIYIYGAA